MLRRRIWPCWLAGISLLAILQASYGQQAAVLTETQERLALGQTSYEVFCHGCHGESGRGDGPLADLLKVVPSDLTRLTEKYGGEFPAEHVARAIDGREDVRGHVPRGMPVWGLGFQSFSRDSNQEEEVQARILDLVTYLRSIQATEPPTRGDAHDR